MTKDNKKNLLLFITRTGMYIHLVDDKNIISFIHGYELGTKHKCDFTQLSKQLLADKYKITYSSDGWPGQITRLSKKLSLSWVTTFKRTALEIVAAEGHDGLDQEMREILKSRIVSLIGRINTVGDPWFNDSWTEEWLSLCSVKNKWFRQLWTDNEWMIIKSIDKHVQADKIFVTAGNNIPTPQLVKLKDQFDNIATKNGT